MILKHNASANLSSDSMNFFKRIKWIFKESLRYSTVNNSIFKLMVVTWDCKLELPPLITFSHNVVKLMKIYEVKMKTRLKDIDKTFFTTVHSRSIYLNEDIYL